jgi:uncharacterized membrane protein YgdD (TMEM256/DUF423 family)
MAKLFITLAAISGMLAVLFGAFGAHALKGRLDDQALNVFETAVQYHFYHTFALLMVGAIALSQPPTALLKSSGWLFVIGILVFSGSLYLLSFTGMRWLGAITPFGGLAFIAAWACLAAAGWKLLV